MAAAPEGLPPADNLQADGTRIYERTCYRSLGDVQNPPALEVKAGKGEVEPSSEDARARYGSPKEISSSDLAELCEPNCIMM